MAAKLFDDILLKGIRSGQVPARTRQARDWYRSQADKVARSSVSETKIIRQMGEDRYESRFRIGQMYTFIYDPKHKETLPYYDRFPLIFPINRAKGGFLGLNFHYLPLPLRANLMDALYEVSSNQNYNETTKMQVSYSVLNGAAKYREFKPTVKHYLTSQIRTKLVYIHPTEWDIALFLPTEQFEKASKGRVWADSRKIIRGGR
jgi:hypothetical protein